jgi:hypothetical protein
VRGIDSIYGPKKDLILMDNNVVASPRFKEIIAEIRDLGFVPGATLKRGRVPVQRRVDFNQGVDARILCKDPIFLREISTICIKPLRIAFDHIGVRKPYEAAIRYAAEFGLRSLSNYMLYNFHDSPADLFQRMRLNIELNEQLGIRIFSFPMRYQPVTFKDRSYIGKNWNRYYLRSMQIILQATHGIVSGAPAFFKRAFGDTEDKFESLLLRPHHYTFNRVWFEELKGRAELDEYESEIAKLSEAEKAELLSVLSAHEKSEYRAVARKLSDTKLKRLMKYYIPPSREAEREIWNKQKKAGATRFHSEEITMPDDERVEDAGLEEAA